MKPASVYIVGGAGTGKSTFMAQLLEQIGDPLGPLEDLHSTPNARGTVVTLRGHHMGPDGLYLGCMRESFPGTDGLDRASSLPGEQWILEGKHKRLSYIVGEGATLATRRFLGALAEHTDFLLVHLTAEDWVKELRFAQRGSNQKPEFVQATATRSRNLVRDLNPLHMEVDSADPESWEDALRFCELHLSGIGQTLGMRP